MALRLLVLLLLFVSTVPALAGQKPIATFDAIDYERDWFDAWSGTVTVAPDTADKVEGAASMKLTYSLDAWGGVEYLRNFGADASGVGRTQDYSFMFDGIAIRIKGNGSSDRFRFMLYEDVNRDGVYEDVWVYSNSNVLANTAWTPITMRLASFKRQGGDNGSTLDLNRIGKWRIVIDNRDGVASANRVVRLDDMRLVNLYAVPQVAPKGLNGSFIQVWNGAGCDCATWTVQRWGEELQKMADARMGTVIVQYGMWHGADNTVAAFYPSALPFVNWRFDTIPNLLAAAELKGMKVVLGLYFNQSWDQDRDWSQGQVYSDVVSYNTQVIDELWTKYGASPAFGGWYIPQEIDDLHWQSDSRRALLANMVQTLAARAKSKSATHPVMIAPFFRMNQPADVYEQWWINFLAAAPSVDWIIPQDGVGTGDTDLDTDVPHYFRALQRAVAASPGRNLGATVESFQNVNGTFGPTTWAKLQDQLRVASETATRLFQFEWPYMQPSRGLAYDQLYQAYKGANLTPP
jgi:hypothetical protein